ncbi:MAG TPA: L-asparaginase 1 [Clostridiales bacterium]|jgi:L-asparaginase|nr:L-asparaginase 1 [Clostridiales bacterium]
MKKILLISTGGTIASTVSDDGLTPTIKPEEMLKYLKNIDELCEIDSHQLLNIDSTNIQPEHWIDIVKFIKEKYEKYDGFVITHGTDTLAYTSAALSYLIQDIEKPIILTGSQKPINVDTTDAKKNLKDAIRFAVEDDVKGVYIVFDGKGIVGTRARKTRTKSFNAFESINFPYAAFIDDDRIAHYIHNKNSKIGVKFYENLYPNVFLLKLAPGMDPDVIDYIGKKYEGVVIESYGSGGLPFEDRRNFLEKLGDLTSKGKIVVISTQVAEEGSDLKTYEVGLKTIKRYQILQAYDMTVESAITKLMWIMGITKDYDQVKAMFYNKINNDIMYK